MSDTLQVHYTMENNISENFKTRSTPSPEIPLNKLKDGKESEKNPIIKIEDIYEQLGNYSL